MREDSAITPISRASKVSLEHAAKAVPQNDSTAQSACSSERAQAESSGLKIRLDALSSVNYLNLPRLPIPELSQTLSGLLVSCRVLDKAQAFARLEDKAKAFERLQGPQLQQALKIKDQQPGYPFSFIQEIWDDAYLTSRQAHPINTSPFFELDPQKVSGVLQAAQFARAVVDWTIKLRQGHLPAHQGLCLSAAGKLFATAKIPHTERDRITSSETSDNIVILHKGNILSAPVLHEGGVVSSQVIEQAMLRALQQPANPEAVGVLTAAERPIWAKARERLVECDPRNLAVLQKIDDAILVVCLDDAAEYQTLEDHARSFLVGNTANRWFDKHQLILHVSTGRVGLNFEHACSDGTNWLQVIQDCVTQMESTAVETQPAALDCPVEPLEFTVPEDVSSVISAQKALAKQRVQNVDTKVLSYDEWGKNFAKRQGLSPDALVQMAFQLAYYRLKGDVAPTYESAQMRRFFCGRTDTIRSCSEDAKAFVQSWQHGIGGLDALVAAAKQHSVQSKQVAAGGGIDRHLLALQTEAAAQRLDVPLFDDPLYKRASTWMLSTSNASDPNLTLFGFGPVCESGYGLGYLIQPESININVTAYKSAGNSASAFADALGQALDDIYKAFEDHQAAPSQKLFA